MARQKGQTSNVEIPLETLVEKLKAGNPASNPKVPVGKAFLRAAETFLGIKFDELTASDAEGEETEKGAAPETKRAKFQVGGGAGASADAGADAGE